MDLEKKKALEIKNKQQYYSFLSNKATDIVKAKYDRKCSIAIRKIEEKYKRKAKWKPARKEKEVTLTMMMREIQIYVRLRDTDINWMWYCISCWKPLHYKQWDGGHYISRTYKSIIDNLDNIHLQCKWDNKKMSTRSKIADEVVKVYRKNLIEKIWKKKVLWLENEAERTKYEVIKIEKSYIKEQYEKYKKLNKELESKKRPLLV